MCQQSGLIVIVSVREKMKSPNPLICVISLPALCRTQTHKFQHNCSASELTEIQKILKLEKLIQFSFKGQLIKPKKNNYELYASLKAIIIQNCVITCKPVKTIVNDQMSRYYLEESIENQREDISSSDSSKDIELIRKELNIGAVAIEALSLRIPDYPRKRNVQFEGVTITSMGLKPIDKTLTNPFLVLKDFPTK